MAPNLPQPVAATAPARVPRQPPAGDDEGVGPVTSYTLRKGAADKTKADVVVVGVVRTPKGLRAAHGGEAVASAYGSNFAPLLAPKGFTGKPDNVAKVRTEGTIKQPLLILVGLGDANGLD